MFWFRGSVRSFQLFPCLSRFGRHITKNIAEKKSASTLSSSRFTHFSKVSLKMDSDSDCSDFGLKSMFDEGLQCCLNSQQNDSLSSKYNDINVVADTASDSLNLGDNVDDQQNLKIENSLRTSGDDLTDFIVDDNAQKKSEKVISSDSKTKSRWKRKKRKKVQVEFECAECESTQTEANSGEESKKTEEEEVKKKKKRKKKNTVNESGGEDNEVNDKPPRKKSPNYFIAIRVSNPSIHSAFKVIQDSIIAKEPLLQPALIPLSTLHITLLVMHLEKDQLPKAIEVLHECQNCINQIVEDKNTMTFEGLDHFRNEVVFGKLIHEGEIAVLQQAADVIRNGYKACGLELDLDDKPFKPHLTLMKLSKIPFKKKKKKLRKIPEDVYSSWIDCELGVQHFTEVLLCSMIDKKQEDGFYHCIGSVTIARPTNTNTELSTMDSVPTNAGNIANNSEEISSGFVENEPSKNDSDNIGNDVDNGKNHSESTSREEHRIGASMEVDSDDCSNDHADDDESDKNQLDMLSTQHNKIVTSELVETDSDMDISKDVSQATPKVYNTE